MKLSSKIAFWHSAFPSCSQDGPKTAPRRFVPVRRSQSLFEELWERPLIRRRRSRFGRSLALAGTPCQNYHDETDGYQTMSYLIPNFVSLTASKSSYAVWAFRSTEKEILSCGSVFLKHIPKSCFRLSAVHILISTLQEPTTNKKRT